MEHDPDAVAGTGTARDISNVTRATVSGDHPSGVRPSDSGVPSRSGRMEPVNTDAVPRVHSTPAIFAFLVMAFGWSWGLGFAARYTAPPLRTILAMTSGLGPSIAAVAVVAFHSDGAGLRDWLKQCLRWRPVRWRWYAVAFGLPPAVMMLGLAIEIALGGTIAASPASGHVALAVANFGLVLLVGGPLGEEFGWRGYALPAIASALRWRNASLLVGLIWGLWHLPLFFMTDTPQSHMPFLLFLASTIAESVMLAWLFVRTGLSVLAALVMHTSMNAWLNIIPVLPTAATANSLRPLSLMVGIQVLIAVGLLFQTNRHWGIAPGLGRVERGARSSHLHSSSDTPNDHELPVKPSPLEIAMCVGHTFEADSTSDPRREFPAL